MINLTTLKAAWDSVAYIDGYNTTTETTKAIRVAQARADIIIAEGQDEPARSIQLKQAQASLASYS